MVHGQRQVLAAQILSKSEQSLDITGDDDDRNTWASTVYAPVQEIISGLKGAQGADVKHISKNTTKGTAEELAQDFTTLPPPDFFNLRRSVQLPCYLLCSYTQNPDFLGRDDVLAQMNDVLLPASQARRQVSNGSQSFVISGMGGIGKTQSALEFAVSRRGKFDAILWAHADTTVKLDESFSQFSVALGLEDATNARDRVVSRSLVLEWLSNPVKGSQASPSEDDPAADMAKCLLVFENADDLSVLADFWPSCGSGAIVLTSRDPLGRNYLSSNGIELEPLTTEHAAALLRKLSELDENPGEIEASMKIAKRMGGLPLAVILAAAAILRQELTLEEFLAFYEVEPKAADVRPISLKPENQYQHTLSTVWALDTLEKPTECLLRLLSVMDPDSISENIITQKMLSGLPHGYPDNMPAFINARTSLLKSPLVKRDKASCQLSLHRLIQDFTRVKMSFVELKECFVAALQFCIEYWPKPAVAVSFSIKTWPASQAVVSHLLSLREFWKKQLALVDGPKVKQQLADLTWRVAWYFVERRMFGEDIQGLRMSSLQICESEVSLRLSDTNSQAVLCLATSYGHENNPLPRLEYAMINPDIAITIGNDPKPSQFLGLAYNQLGEAHLLNDRWEDAAKAFRDSINVYNEWDEVKHRGYRPESPWGSLATVLAEMGSNEEAAEILLENIRYREKVFGPADTDSIKFGRAIQALGCIRLEQGRLDESFDCFQKALTNYRITSGPRYFRTGQVSLKLGELYSFRRQYTKADSHFIETLEVFQDRTPYKGECARILHLRAKIYEAIEGSKVIANELESRAWDLYKEVVESRRLSVYGAPLDVVNFDKVDPTWSR